MAHEENAPLNITPGAIRFNTDSMKLEYFRIGMEGATTSSYAGIGSQAAGEWVQLTTDSPDIRTGGTRGCFCGGQNEPSPTIFNIIDFIQIETTGNAEDFGDLSSIEQEGGALGGHLRGYFFGGDPAETAIETFIFGNTAGDPAGGQTATSYGSLTVNSKTGCGSGNRTRGVIFIGDSGGGSNVMNYITLSTTGSGVDFGDSTLNPHGLISACGSPTRALVSGGSSKNAISYVTISTLGNTSDFGDMTTSKNGHSSASNAIRGLFSGGYSSPSGINVIEYITISTLGNAQDFGDLTRATRNGTAVSSPTRYVHAGGTDTSAPGGPMSDVMDYVQIMTTGNAIDFGNLTQGRRHVRGCSNGNGGVG